MKGERRQDEASVSVFNSDGTIIENRKVVAFGGRFRAAFPKDSKVVVSYSMGSTQPNRAERRRRKRK